MFVLPIATPVATPVEALIVAIAVEPDDQVPEPTASVRVTDWPVHSVSLPEIAVGTTVTAYDNVAAVPQPVE